MNDVATKAKANVAEQVATVEDKLRDSQEGPPPPPPKRTDMQQQRHEDDEDVAVGILGRVPMRALKPKASGGKSRPDSPGPPPPPSGAMANPKSSDAVAPSPNRFGFMGGVEQTKMSGKGRGNNYEAKKMAWELREARLEEELDEAQQQNSELRGQLGRLEKELIKARESVAHHRQKAVEARLELQEMKGTYKANGSTGHLNHLTSKFTHTQHSITLFY